MYLVRSGYNRSRAPQTARAADLWRPTEPLTQALKDELPNLVTVSRNYREPICFNTERNIERGQRAAK